MPLTITAVLKDAKGAAIPNAILRVTLGGYGALIPRVVGSSIIASTAPIELVADGAGNVSFTPIGNDTITPAGTFYTVQVLDADKNPVQSNDYQFTGAAALDLSNLAPYNPPPQTVPIVTTGLPPVFTQTTITNPGGIVVGPSIVPTRNNIGAMCEIMTCGILVATVGTAEASLRVTLAGGGTIGPFLDVAAGQIRYFTMKMRFPIQAVGYWSGEVFTNDNVGGYAVSQVIAGSGPYDFTSFTKIDVSATLAFTGSLVIDWLVPRITWY